MDISELINLLPEDKREEAAELFKAQQGEMIRGAIARVAARNLSHGLPEHFQLNEKTQKKQHEV